MNSKPTSDGPWPHPPNGNGAHRSGTHRRGIVLIVDDEADLRAALERRFRLAGLHPLSCATTEEAWRLLDSWVVHVVCADERLRPGESGAVFLIDVGRAFPSIGRLLLTAYLEPALEDLGREHGFATIDKSSKWPDVLAAVRREIGADA